MHYDLWYLLILMKAFQDPYPDPQMPCRILQRSCVQVLSKSLQRSFRIMQDPLSCVKFIKDLCSILRIFAGT